MAGKEIQFDPFLTFWIVAIETKVNVWIFGLLDSKNKHIALVDQVALFGIVNFGIHIVYFRLQ